MLFGLYYKSVILSNLKIKNIFFLLTLVIFSMPGTIEHAWQLRTELMTLFYDFKSFNDYILFSNENSKYQVEKLSFLFFLYSAILNKSQVFYFPF